MGFVYEDNKIKIYVSVKLSKILQQDAEQFEIYKPNGRDVNMNRFMRLLVMGYYESFNRERIEKDSAIKELIKPYINSSENLDIVAERLVNNIAMPQVPKRLGKRKVIISLKITNDIKPIINDIASSLGAEDYMSQFLCRMILSYSEKPIYERERIIFRDKVLAIQEQCTHGCEISFSTQNRPDLIHKVIPYKLVYGPEEMFNYLLCQELNQYTGSFEARTYRLARISKPNMGPVTKPIDQVVRYHLEKMENIGPQYPINEDVTSVVELTEEGVTNFRKIYLGRPKKFEEQKTETPGKYRYLFNCSTDQLFFYFRRFQPEEAIVIEPASLREKIRDFHAAAMKVYG